MRELILDFPRSLSSYPVVPGQSLLEILRARVAADPINAVATLIFVLAVIHTFLASRFTEASHRVQARHDAELAGAGLPSRPSVAAEMLHFLGEVEVVFGLWTVPLLGAILFTHGWSTAAHYANDTVNYTEPLFVVVIMALASTRPIIMLAESSLRALANIGGGTLTHFAAPPVLMVSRTWEWTTPYMLGHFGWRAVVAIIISTISYYLFFRKEFARLKASAWVPDVEVPADDADPSRALLPVPAWVTLTHLGFMAWTVLTVHYPGLFLGGFLFFLGFARATAAYQAQIDMKTPLLVGFFLAGLVIHGGLQGWWIAPVLSSLSPDGVFWGATTLTAFNDNALITYLATLVPNLSEGFKMAVVEGAVTGGGLTVIANAPNPAGQALLGKFFDDAVSPARLFAAAIIPTLIAAAAFRLL